MIFRFSCYPFKIKFLLLREMRRANEKLNVYKAPLCKPEKSSILGTNVKVKGNSTKLMCLGCTCYTLFL